MSRDKYENSMELLPDARAGLGLLRVLNLFMRFFFRQRNDDIFPTPKDH